MVYGYVVVYGCPEGNRLAKWYWDCEIMKMVNSEVSAVVPEGGRKTTAVTIAFFVIWSLRNV